jgi:hypothetical protein
MSLYQCPKCGEEQLVVWDGGLSAECQICVYAFGPKADLAWAEHRLQSMSSLDAEYEDVLRARDAAIMQLRKTE